MDALPENHGSSLEGGANNSSRWDRIPLSSYEDDANRTDNELVDDDFPGDRPFASQKQAQDEAELKELQARINLNPTVERVRAVQQENILDTITASSLAGVAVPPRDWFVEGLIPAYTVTLLNGDGGTGKSLLALMLAVAAQINGYWVGRAVLQGLACFLTAEDDVDEVHRRLADIVREFELELTALKNLHICSLAGKDALLAVPEGKGNVLKATKLFEALEAFVAKHRPSLLVLDTLADLFGGDEIQRAQARQFISLLRGLCTRYRVTIVMLAHPSIAGMASGTGSSGSTAWNNSVRSRLYLDRLKEKDGGETDTDVRVLRTVKSNYGKIGDEMMLRWVNGVFKLNTNDSLNAVAAMNNIDRVFLQLLERYAVEGRKVSHSAGANYAPALFEKDQQANGIKKRGFITAMNRLFEAGRIKALELGPPSRRSFQLVVVEPDHAE
ncbi:AAA family ATPase [Phyllobacterium chamaecytisi]|uniref:AAA family ATPase n=1 Tax=Phyllobacterium chamaecytisi TaxID=2876082 RepID=UPI001CCA6D17|nr:AAA family ATPase [Phyllobacterium sp. KW56]MBZ9603993.1 AAA family ATPase [Phyllobacterium sp. KW56]